MFQNLLKAFGDHFGNCANKSRRRVQPTNTIPAECESLEHRQVLSATAVLQKGVLSIAGSNGDDQIYLRQVNGRISIDGVSGSWAASQVKAIVVVAGAGNDEVILLNSQLVRGLRLDRGTIW